MSTTVEELERRMSLPSETEHIEFKEAENQKDTTRLFKCRVALANERGGKLILGVTDRRPRRVVGSQAFQKIEKITSSLVPSRPVGTPLHLDGRYLMRSGERLVPMTAD